MKSLILRYFAILALVAFGMLLAPASQAGEKLLVSSFSTQEIFSFDGQTGDFNEVFISSPSLVGELRGLTIGPDGDIFGCFRTGDRILRFDGETGCFKETFVPDNSGGLVNPIDLAFGPDGNLFVLSSNLGIYRYDGTTGAFIDLFIPVDSGITYELYAPSSLVMDLPNDRLLVSDMNNGSVLEFTASTGSYDGYFVSPYSNGLDAPRGMVLGPDSHLYVSSLTNDGAILRFNGATGNFIDIFVDNLDGGMEQPEGLAFGSGGDLFVSDIYNDRILKFDGSSGNPLGTFVPNGSNGLDDPYGLVFGQDGNLYVAAYLTGLMTFDGQTGDFLSLIANGYQLDDPRGMTEDLGGNLYFSDNAQDKIQRYDSQNGCFIDHFVSSSPSPTFNPRDLVFGPDGNLYVVSSIDGIYRFDGTTGGYIDLFVPVDFGTVYTLDAPAALLFGPDDNLYVCDMNNGSVIRFNGVTGAYIDDFVSPYSGNLDAPREMVFGPDGHLYVSNLYNNGTILRFNGTNGNFIDTFVSAGSGGLDQPEGLVFGQDNHLYVSDNFNDRILQYDGANGNPLGTFVSAGSGGLSSPYNLLFVEDAAVNFVDGTPSLPRNLLRPNFPNPFNPKTQIEYLVPKSGLVRLGIFDSQGHNVAMLVYEQLDAGWHEVVWQGTNREGRRVPSGLYFYRLDTGGHSETRKMMLLK